MNTLIFGTILKELREKSGMSQGQLAERIGISKSSISLYELHARMPSVEILAGVAEAFRVSTDYLIGIKKTKSMDLSGLNEDEIKIPENLAEYMRRKK